VVFVWHGCKRGIGRLDHYTSMFFCVYVRQLLRIFGLYQLKRWQLDEAVASNVGVILCDF